MYRARPEAMPLFFPFSPSPPLKQNEQGRARASNDQGVDEGRADRTCAPSTTRVSGSWSCYCSSTRARRRAQRRPCRSSACSRGGRSSCGARTRAALSFLYDCMVEPFRKGDVKTYKDIVHINCVGIREAGRSSCGAETRAAPSILDDCMIEPFRKGDVRTIWTTTSVGRSERLVS